MNPSLGLYQRHSYSPIICQEFGFHQLSRPESQSNGCHGKDIAGCGSCIEPGCFALVNVNVRSNSRRGRHRGTRKGWVLGRRTSVKKRQGWTWLKTDLCRIRPQFLGMYMQHASKSATLSKKGEVRVSGMTSLKTW